MSNSNSFPDDLELAPKRTVGEWKGLVLDAQRPELPDWNKAIEIFQSRIQTRFLEPCDALLDLQHNLQRKTFGFAILAIDCLVIETIQGFREGEVSHEGKSRKLFVNFLRDWPAFSDCIPPEADADFLAQRIYAGYRCALHHSGATDGDFRVGVRPGRMIEFGPNNSIRINRTILHGKLKSAFEAYLLELRRPESEVLRVNFLRKMNSLCGIA